MSGTRKMDKFELDEFQQQREAELADLPARPFEPRNPDPPAPPPPATGDIGALQHVLATAAAEATRAQNAMNMAHARLSDPQQPVAAPISEPAATPRNATPADHFVPAEATLPPPAEQPASGSQEAATPDALRTRLARKFVSLADTMTEAFKDFAIGAGAWNVELTVPQGMSTGGGKQALQHVRLNPRRGGYNVFVAGTVNQVERRAELRDFDHVAIMHEVRHRSALEITSQEWEQFLRKAEVVLNGAGIQSMRTPPPRELLEQRRSAQRVSKGAIIALVVVLVLASIVAWRVIVALRAGT